jgi:hypothetical protein
MTVLRLDILGFLISQQLQQPPVLNLVFRYSEVGLGNQLSITRKFLLVDEAIHCDLQDMGELRGRRFPQYYHPKRRLTFVKDDGVLLQSAESAMPFHVDGIPRAFPRVGCLERSQCDRFAIDDQMA